MKNDLVELFLTLVKIDSPSGNETEVCKFIASYLEKMGIKSKTDKVGNLFACVSGKGEPVILGAHMDTVEPGCGIKPKIEKGIIKSDGTTILGADNKIAIACILAAITKVPKENRKSLELVFSVREETNSGINEFDFSLLRGKVGLVADRASFVGVIVLSSPWIENLTVDVIGKSTHAGSPEKGINALSLASEAISKLTWGRISSKTTANIGTIKGGSAMNTIPEKIELVGEVRSFSESQLVKQVKKIRSVFTKTVEGNGGKLIFVTESTVTDMFIKSPI